MTAITVITKIRMVWFTCNCPVTGGMTDITIRGSRYMTRRFTCRPGETAGMTAGTVIATETTVIGGGSCPAGFGMTTITLRRSRNMAAAFTAGG